MHIGQGQSAEPKVQRLLRAQRVNRVGQDVPYAINAPSLRAAGALQVAQFAAPQRCCNAVACARVPKVSTEMVGSLTGGTISGETRRKGVNNISYLVAHKPVGKEGVQYSHVRGRETGFARVTPSLQCDDSNSQPRTGTGERI